MSRKKLLSPRRGHLGGFMDKEKEADNVVDLKTWVSSSQKNKTLEVELQLRDEIADKIIEDKDKLNELTQRIKEHINYLKKY